MRNHNCEYMLAKALTDPHGWSWGHSEGIGHAKCKHVGS